MRRHLFVQRFFENRKRYVQKFNLSAVQTLYSYVYDKPI